MTAIRSYPGERFLERFPDPPRRAPVVAAVFPNTYRIGMSNLGYHFLFGALARRGRLRVERLFSDTGAVPRGLRAVLFSVSYEEDITACAAILGRLGIEPLRRRRGEGPLVIAGGPAVSANPLPVAAIADAVALGEGEETLGCIIDVLAEPGMTASDAREALALRPHMFVPGAGGEATIAATAAGRFVHSCLLATETAFPGTFLVEISRGCPGSCRFCLATQLYRPYRVMPMANFRETIEGLPVKPEAIGLVSTAAAAHPEFASLLRYLAGRGCRTGLSSLRAEDVNAETASAIAEAGIRSVALAPESGSEPLRQRLGKRVPDEVFMEAARLLSRAGVRHLSLYLLAGVPGEGRSDEERTLRFLATFAAAAAGCRVTLHVNPLVPKPATPLQHMGMATAPQLRAATARLAADARRIGLAVSLKGVRAALRQAQLSLGDERTGEAAVRFAAGGTSWRRALSDAGVDPDAIHRERGLEAPLPWERFAAAELRRSLLRRYRLFVAGGG